VADAPAQTLDMERDEEGDHGRGRALGHDKDKHDDRGNDDHHGHGPKGDRDD